MARWFVVPLLLAGLLGGCASIPGAGPRPATVVAEAGRSAEAGTYRLMNLDIATVRLLNAAGAAPPPAALPPVGAAIGLLGPGDLLRIVMWEQGPMAVTMMPERPGIDLTTRVGADGTLSLPYAGRLRVAGRSPAQVEADIRGRLAPETRGLQASVLVVEEVANAILVQGEVARPGRLPLHPGTRGVLDAIALAGGARPGVGQLMVQVTRRGQSATRSLAAVQRDGAPDLALEPGDRVLVLPREQAFYAFGAVNRPGEQVLTLDDTTLIRTLARVAGLSELRADASAVFLYRRHAGLPPRPEGPAADPSRTIFRLDLRDPRGFFLAGELQVLPEDVVYVGEAPLAEIGKALQLVTGWLGVTRTVAAPL
jgi:polysaccharide export outer membrane protein